MDVARLLGERRTAELEDDLKCSGLRIKPKTFISLSLFASLAVALAFLAFAWNWVDPAIAPILFLLSFPVIFLLLLRIPKLVARSRAREVEADLPIQLRAISTELAIGVPFEDALESASRLGGRSGGIFGTVAFELRGGASVEEALRKVRGTVRSRMLDKALSHLAFIYSYGYEGSGLGKLVDELSSEQRSRIKEYASRSSVMGVMLIALTSVIPALATAYILVGSSFMDLSLAPEDVYIIYVAVLPAATLAFLLAMRLLSPHVSKRGSDFLSAGELTKFTVFLGRAGISMRAQQFLIYLSLASVLLSALLYAYTSSPLSFTALLAPLFVYGIFLYNEDHRTSQMEDYMPDALFYASSLHTLGLERVIERVAQAGYGPLSQEFGRASRQISAGFPVKVSLNSLMERNDSPVIRRGVSLLVKIHEVGAPLEGALKGTAEDIHSMFMLMKERGTVLSLQKYNLVMACLLVPAIFGALLSLVSSLDLSYIESLLSTPSSRGLYPAVEFSIGIYLAEFSLLASLFLADYGGSWKRFAVHLVFLMPLIFAIHYTVWALT